MPSPRPSFLLPILALGLAGAGLRSVTAQVTTNATCLSTWSDLYNSRGQSPCLVAAYLGGACNGGQYEVPALDEDQHYIGPTALIANDCLCSTVYYSLMGACSVCQNASIITWSSWTSNCPTVYSQVFSEDIPSDTAVPGWAYETIPTNGTFNVFQALQDASPESTATFLQTTNTGTRTSGSSSTASAAGEGSDDDEDGGSNTGAIAGGVVGGVVGLALIALGGFFLYRRNQRKRNALVLNGGSGIQANLTGASTFVPPKDDYQYAPVPYTPHAYEGETSPTPPVVVGVGAGGGGGGGGPGYDPAGATGGSGGGGLPVMQQKLYDPNDPSTFPTATSLPPTSMQTQYSGGSGPGPGPGSTPSFSQAQQQPHYDTQYPSSNQGQYRGVAEV